MLKLFALSTMSAAFAASGIFATAPTQIAALAAGVASAIYLYRTLLLPFAQLVRRSLTAYQHLEQLGPFVEETHRRLDDLEGTAAANEDRLEAITRHLQVPRRERDRRARPA